MVKDRLSEMESKRKELQKAGSSSTNKENKKMKPHTLTDFLSKVTKIEEMLKKATEDITDMDRMQKDLYSNPFYTQEDIKVMNVKKLEQISDQILNASVKIRKEIDILRTDVSNCAEKSGENDSDTNLRMKTMQVDRLTGQLSRMLNEYRKKQAEYVDKTKARLRRQADIVHNNDPESQNLLDNSMFTGDYLADVQRTKFTLQELDQRTADLQSLEKDVCEVHKLFKEVNLLVSEQGEKIDLIENNVEQAAVHVEMGDAELIKARKYRAKARRRKFIICGIILIVVLVIGAIVAIAMTA